MKKNAFTLLEGGQRPLLNLVFGQAAFTLAEVLITLSVIGIVAVLTIPSFINNTMKKEYSVALRKRYAELTQVARLAAIENGHMISWDWSGDTDAFVKKYLTPYLKLSNCENCWTTAQLPQGMWFEQSAEAAPAPVVPEDYAADKSFQLNCYTNNEGANCPALKAACQHGSDGYADLQGVDLEDGGWLEHAIISYDQDMCNTYLSGGYSSVKPADEPEITYALPDGSQMGFYKQNNKSVLFIYLDVNGKKRPNKFGVDKYLMMLSGDTVAFWGEGESDLTSGEYGCSTEGNGFYCGALLKANNWNFDENYPKL